MAKSKDEDIRIFELPEATSLPAGMYVAVDNETLGTKKYNISEALDNMATSADVEEIRGELESKVDTDTLSSYYTKTETDNEFVSKIGYVATDNNYTTPEKEKLSGIESGAQKNVKPDWNAAAGNAAEILNKPTIPTASGLAGDGLEESGGKLKVVTKVPDPGDNEHRGQVLTVGNSDEVAWAYSDAAVVIIESTMTSAEKKAKFEQIRAEGKIPAFWYNATKESVTRNVLCEWKYDVGTDHYFMGSSIISPNSSLNGHPRVFWVTAEVNANWTGEAASFVGLTEVPQSDFSNNGQVLMVDGTNPAWMPLPKELPPSSAQLSGRVLTVDSTGNPAWAAVPTELPSSTSSDQGKVLTVGSNGGPGWDYPEDELPSYDSQTLVGTYLSVCSGSNNNNELRWAQAPTPETVDLSAGSGIVFREEQQTNTTYIDVDTTNYKLITTAEYNTLTAKVQELETLLTTYSGLWVLTNTPQNNG